MYTDLIIRIKNAQTADKKVVRMPYSKMNEAISELLKNEGFLKKAETKGRAPKRFLKLYLNPEKKFERVKFFSKPSIRRYGSYKDVGLGSKFSTIVLSTSKGIITDREAKKQKVGGQVLFGIR